MGLLGCCGLTKALFSQSCTEFRRAKCSYCIGVSSIVIMVTLAAVFQTVLHNTPLIFLREAEVSNGQMDVIVYPSSFTDNFALNYTLVAQLAAVGGSQFTYSSPRYQLGATMIPAKACTGYPAYTPNQDNYWMYNISNCLGDSPLVASCNTQSSEVQVNFVLIDSAKEKRMALGRSWSISSSIPAGSVVISSADAASLGVRVGDTVIVKVDVPWTVRHALEPTTNAYDWPEWALFCGEAVIPFTVHATFQGSSGKFSKGVRVPIVAEYGSFLEHVAGRLHPSLRANTAYPPRPDVPQGPANRANATAHSLYDYAPQIVFNFPPLSRLSKYISANYDTIQSHLVEFTSTLFFLIGFQDTDSSVPLLRYLSQRRFVSIFLGLLLNVVLFVLFALCCILIYSLMTINVQKRTFELAVRRLIGTSRTVLIAMLSMQSFLYSFPAWIVGLILGRIFTGIVMRQFTKLSGLPVRSNLTPAAVGWATGLAFGVAILASIGPIHSAMASSLRDALDFDRPKSTAVKYSIERAEDHRISWAVVAVGTGLVLFGFAIYYLIPLSLLSLNLELFVNVFFWILMASLIGMVMMAMNVEILVERVLARVLLFWERRVVVNLAVSNLIAHRVRNRKTMVMYSLALAFIVFLTVASNQEIQVAQYNQMQANGAPILIDPPTDADWPTMAALERILTAPNVTHVVRGFSWMARRPDQQVSTLSGPDVENVGRVYSASLSMRGVQPTFFRSLYQQFIQAGVEGNSALPIPEQLYTVRGSQGVVLSHTMEPILGAGVGTPVLLETSQSTGGSFNAVKRTRVNTHALMDQCSYLSFAKYPNDAATDGFTSLPTMVRLLNDLGYNTSVRTLQFEKLFIDLHSGVSTHTSGALVASLWQVLINSTTAWWLEDNTNQSNDLDVTITLLNLVFSVLTAVAMFLCFFSLLASMMANINEQQKESLILVLAASFMGAAIGVVTAIVFTLQQTLFNQMPIQFGLPWLIILLVAIISALLSAAVPAYQLTKTSITKLLRNVY